MIARITYSKFTIKQFEFKTEKNSAIIKANISAVGNKTMIATFSHFSESFEQ